jgi:ubiquinone/menaquinone biosynthesis C-methylase UbiE
MGELVAGDRQSYQYLVESIRRFPNQVMVLGVICTFVIVKYEQISASSIPRFAQVLTGTP